MDSLIVQTLPDRNYIAAFVANAEGMPALGLGPANFKLRSTLPGADGSNLVIASVGASRLRGFYSWTWRRLAPSHGVKGSTFST